MDSPKIQAEGQLERAEGARYKHGSHILFPPEDRVIRFILRSETIQLREYEGQRVRITASLVEDYPPNAEPPRLLGKGEPKLLEVFSITSLHQEEEEEEEEEEER
jgi:hypothetical protein